MKHFILAIFTLFVMALPGFSQKLKTFYENGKYGLKTNSGTVVITAKLDDIVAYNQLFKIKFLNKYGLLDAQGNLITQIIYDYIQSPSEGKLLARKNGNYGYLDSTGKEIIDFIYEDGSRFRYGHAGVRKQKTWGVIDNTGFAIIPFEYEFIGEAGSDGTFRVKSNGKTGILNLEGKIVVPIKYSDIFTAIYGNWKVKENYKYGVLDRNGTEILPVMYDNIIQAGQNLILAKFFGKWAGFTGKGAWIFPPKYQEVFPADDDGGYTPVQLNNKWGYINANGQEVIPPRYDTAGDFSNEMFAWVSINHKRGAIGRNGEELIPIKYDYIGKFTQWWEGLDLKALAPIAVNSKWGFMDASGKEAIPPKYDKAEPFGSDGKAKVVLNGNMFYIDSSGKKVNE